MQSQACLSDFLRGYAKSAEVKPTFSSKMQGEKFRENMSSEMACKAREEPSLLGFSEPQPTFALQISETTEMGTCDAGSGTLINCILSVVSDISDDNCTHTPSARRCPREAKLSRRAELRRSVVSRQVHQHFAFKETSETIS